MKTERGGAGDIRNTSMGGHLKLNVSNKSIKKRKVKKTRKKNNHRVSPVCSALQELYSSCRSIFKGDPGFVPSPDDVQSICSILDRMKPEDVGLSKNLEFFNPGNSVDEDRRITCTTVYKCKSFLMVLFFLPASAVIPLHNHPEMTVFTKLLFGKMHIKSYDWIDPSEMTKMESAMKPPSSSSSSSPHHHHHGRLARVVAKDTFEAPCDTPVLYPTSGGNIHSFTAITPCVVLDVVCPPYSKEESRDCTYYRDFPFDYVDGQLSKEGYGWLEEIDMPEDSKMDPIPYLGPQIIEDADI